MEGSLVAYKVFTNGSVLNASEINDNLMNQSVMVFSNSTARAAAITSPVEGMLTWLQDTNTYEYRDGSGAWVSLSNAVGSGLAHIQTSTFSSVSSFILDDVFTSTYDNYNMRVNITGVGSGDVDLRLFFRDPNDVTTNLNRERITQFGATITGSSATNNTFGQSSASFTTFANYSVDIFNPNLARVTTYSSNGGYVTNAGQPHQDRIFGYNNSNTVMTGIKIFPSASTFSGTVSIYGIRKS
jgi:hypothetical protein